MKDLKILDKKEMNSIQGGEDTYWAAAGRVFFKVSHYPLAVALNIWDAI